MQSVGGRRITGAAGYFERNNKQALFLGGAAMKRVCLWEEGFGRRRGTVAVMTAVTLVVLLIFASFAVDLGFVGAVCGDMQHTADSAALAGASALVASDGKDTEG